MAMGWEDIRSEVTRRIRSRQWAPGEFIPNEEDLAVEFGVARATVNRALRDLADMGVIERRRKAGTRVAETPVRRATLEIPILRHEVESRGQTYAYRLIDQSPRVLPDAMAARLGLKRGAQALWIDALHMADHRPFAYETRWLNTAAISVPIPRFDAISANEWLVRTVSFVRADIAFSAETATGPESQWLAAPPHSALFVTERMTWSEDAVITWVRLSHAPGYRLLMPIQGPVL